MVLLPLGIILLVKIMPSEILLECRAEAAESACNKKPKDWVAGSIIIAIWVGIIFLKSFP